MIILDDARPTENWSTYQAGSGVYVFGSLVGPRGAVSINWRLDHEVATDALCCRDELIDMAKELKGTFMRAFGHQPSPDALKMEMETDLATALGEKLPLVSCRIRADMADTLIALGWTRP